MTFHPYLQLQVGDKSITTIPPQYVKKLIYKSSLEGLSTIDFTVIDPTYQTMEPLLIGSDTEEDPIFARFGYLNDQGRISSSWIQSRLISFIPRVSSAGMEITASALIDTNNRIVITESKPYEGKISRIAKKIASDMEIDYCVEETTDDDSEVAVVDAIGGQSPKLTSTRNMTLMSFIRKELLPYARSKSSESNYYASVSGPRRERKPILHFHTPEYPDCVTRKQKIKTVTYLAGQQDVVIDFSPSFNSSVLGALGGGKVIMRSYDPATKRFISRPFSNLANPEATSTGEGDSTTNKDTDPTDPLSLARSQGIVLAAEGSDGTSEGRALAKARNTWNILKASAFTASLTLVGLPEYTDIEARDLIKVVMLVPNPTGTPAYKQHWSSGTYLITEAVHEVESQYVISCQLQRDKSDVGPAKIDNPEIPVQQ